MSRNNTAQRPRRWFLGIVLATTGVGCGSPELDQDGDGFTELDNDCDDSDPNVNPSAPEVCGNDVDENCNGTLDELGAVRGTLWYLDHDGDGYGDDTFTVEACNQPDGYAPERWDCDEGNPGVNPGATELCDGIDNDCDGSTDEDSAVDALDWYPDRDGDGFGDDARAIHVCDPPAGYILTPGDCLDGDPLVHPEMQEDCRTPGDDDCDGTPNGATEEAYGCVDFYADLDLDGFPGTASCACEPYGAYTATESTDCNDSDPTRYPGAESTKVWGPEDCDTVASILWHEGAYDLDAQLYDPTGFLDARDIDGDGDTDLLYLNRWAQVFEGPIEVGTAPRDTSVPLETWGYRGGGFVPDVDGDGVDDILVNQYGISGQAGGLYVFSSQADPEADYGDTLFWSSRYMSPAKLNARYFAAQDLDGDGYSELFFGETGSSGYRGEMGFTVIDPDGILGADHYDTSMLNLDGQGYYYAPVPSLHDVNGDGVAELVVGQHTEDTRSQTGLEWSHPGFGTVVIHELTESRQVVPWHTFFGASTLGITGVQVLDVNGDGHADIVGTDDFDLLTTGGGQLVVFLGPHVGDGVYGDWDTSYDADIIVSGRDGDALFHAHAVGDLNLDGRDDIILTNRVMGPEAHTWYLPGLEPGHHRVDEAGRAVLPGAVQQALSLGDTDGDGGQELVMLSFDEDDVDDPVDLLLIDGDLP